MLDEPAYPLGKMAQAAEVLPGTIRTWLQRKQLNWGLNEVEDPQKNGMARMFSLRTVFRVAVVARLCSFGMSPSVAEQYATLVTDRQLTGRESNLLFPEAHTYLVIDPLRSRAVVQAVKSTETNLSYVLDPFEGPEPDTIIRVDLSHLFQRVRSTLGIEGAAP
jgi:hypothetical protein